jgi:hypothetical protein
MIAGNVEVAADAIVRAGLDLPLKRVRAGGEALAGPGALEGRVPIMGAWRGDAVVRCDVGVARRLAGAMYSVPLQHVRVDQVRVAVSQLAAVLASAFQTLLPNPCKVARPVVRAALDADAQRLAGPVRGEARFDCEGESLVLLLIEDAAAN